MTTPTFRLEQAFTCTVAGVDEAGCGAWAGPVVAGAAILDKGHLPETLLKYLNDSKKLTPLRRKYLYTLLKEEEGISCWTAHGVATVDEIDRFNIRKAAHLAMLRAVEALKCRPSYLLIDGNHLPLSPIPAQGIVRGDQQSYSIAAASIIAKVTRDTLMAELAQRYPSYGWERNAGYGTAYHHQALKAQGITPHHRQSFAPIRALQKKVG